MLFIIITNVRLKRHFSFTITILKQKKAVLANAERPLSKIKCYYI